MSWQVERIDVTKLRTGRRIFPPGPPLNAADLPDIVWKISHIDDWVNVTFIDGGKAKFRVGDQVYAVKLDLETCKKARHDWSDPVIGTIDKKTRVVQVCLRCITIKMQDINPDGSNGKRQYYYQTDPRSRT